MSLLAWSCFRREGEEVRGGERERRESRQERERGGDGDRGQFTYTDNSFITHS